MHLRRQGRRTQAPFIMLFAYMMVQMAVLPIFENNLYLGAIGDLTYFVLIFYILVLIQHGRLFWLSAALFALTVVAYGILLLSPTRLMTVVLGVISGAFMVATILSIVSYILQRDRITLDAVLGGLCVYLLIGATFTIIFLNIELLSPGSFDFGPHGADLDMLQLYDLLYFYSFVSLLTIGYGDIIPMSHLAQTLTVLEGMIGQFYIVFCVAVLVGMYVSERHAGNKGT